MPSDDSASRYFHQVLFEGIGKDGQENISKGSVCIVGCGALGSMAAMGLVRAGAGRIRIIDRDFVELRNLHRQVLFDEADARNIMPKAAVAEAKLRKINSEIEIEGAVSDLDQVNIERLLDDFDVIIDGTDNFETRFLINEYSIKHSIPWVYGAARGSYGITFNIIPGTGPCLRCVFEPSQQESSSEACENSGIIPSVPFIVASIQCVEALKILARREDKLNTFISTIDVWEGRSGRIGLAKERSDCPVCALKQFALLQGASTSLQAKRCGRNAVQVYVRDERYDVDLQALLGKIKKVSNVFYNGFLLRIRVEECDVTVFPDGRALINGTEDIDRARSICSRYLDI